MESKTKLYIGGLAWKIRGRQLAEVFSKFGSLKTDDQGRQAAWVKVDRETRKSRGFGFVEFVNSEDAEKAIQEMDGKEVEGRAIKVAFAQEPEKTAEEPTE